MRKSGISQRVILFALAWAVMAGLLVLQQWPDLPRSWRNWVLLLGVGPPVYLLIEAWSTWVLAEGRRWNDKKFSVLRLLLLFPVAMFWFLVAWWLSSFMGGN